ncbi:molecular chaperone Hsp90 [Pedobacter lusitanus]|uniref:Molecular chaperone Hsp90 n=1 Tax=Pedobacter lusitanus TaxID=1503925 RepID=A0A0D0FVB5_9SPHI|nr:HSP90 family protein [Pedobacter lusitanus]KIO76359.1 molecular chaperone Hsp90 [Pedobacter lusitanus]
MHENQQYLFQVNLKGMISLLSEHLYSNPSTFVRELLQNGVDAITAFRTIHEDHEGCLRIYLPDNARAEMIFEDNGIGLKEEEIHKFLAVIGESSKREAFEAKDYIGKFGIGLLSCFVVSNEIIVESRSAFSEKAVRWTGKSDGTYSILEIEEPRSIGTRVILLPKEEFKHLFEPGVFQRNLAYYGEALPMPIYLHYNAAITWINESGARWLNPRASKEELLAIGRKTFNTGFLDAFPISSVNGGVKGVAFVSLYKTQFTGKQSHKLYLKRMFMSEDDCHLLPKWAFFIRCIFNADGLDATASRESLVYNDTLKAAQNEISQSIKSYLKTIDIVDPDIYQKLVSTHYLHLKAIAAEDHELLMVFMDDLLFETNKGPRSYRSIRHLEQTIYYTPNINDFKQIHRIAGSQGILVINAGYTFEEALLKKISQLHPDLKIEQLSPESLLNTFHSVDLQNSAELLDFENRAAVVLQPLNCSCSLKHFNPADTPAIYIGAHEDIDAKSTQESSGFNPLEATLGMFTKKTKVIQPLLCLNVDNKLVKSITGIKDPYLFPSIIHILYVQALMLGKYPVSDREMNLFNEALHNLVIMGMDNFINI